MRRLILMAWLIAAPALACDVEYAPAIEFSSSLSVFQGRVVAVTADSSLRAGEYYPRFDGPTDPRPPAGVLIVEPTSAAQLPSPSGKFAVTQSSLGSECQRAFVSAESFSESFDVGDTLFVVAGPGVGRSASGATPLNVEFDGVLSSTRLSRAVGVLASEWDVPDLGRFGEGDPRAAVATLREVRATLRRLRRDREGEPGSRPTEAEIDAVRAHIALFRRMEYELARDLSALRATDSDAGRLRLLAKVRAYWGWWEFDDVQTWGEADCRYTSLVSLHLQGDQPRTELHAIVSALGLRPFPTAGACESSEQLQRGRSLWRGP